jgi:hypothetical protein
MTKLQKLIEGQLRAFSWSNYGLDEVEDTLDGAPGRDDWTKDLAAEIAGAITDKVEVEL